MLKTRVPLCLLLAAVLACRCTQGGADEPAAFRTGFAERDITPELGMEQPGNYGKAYHSKLHDACKVRAAVFDDGENRVALVGIDALLIRGVTVAAARAKIAAQSGIPAGNVLVAASHSHSAGPTGMILPGEFDHASPLVQSLAYEKSSMANAQYLQRVETAIVEAVVEADRTRQAALCGAGAGHEDQAAFNRRFRMRTGRTMTHPGQGNPDILEPAGPIDPQVGVIGAWNDAGELIGCVVNFACHATTGPGGISADYVHYLEQTIRGLFGQQAIVVFLPGAAADVTQVDNRSPYQIKQFGEVAARRVGGRVGAEAIRALLSMHTGSLAPVAATQRVLKIKRRPPRPERSVAALALVQKDPAQVDSTEWTFAKEIVLLDARLAREPIADVEVQAVQVGPAVFLACPAEYFCQFGLDMRAASPFALTMPVSLANDCIGYVPTEEALGPRGGGYETRLTSYSNLEPTAGRQIADALTALARGMNPGTAPLPPALPPFQGQPWGYGNLPPELD